MSYWKPGKQPIVDLMPLLAKKRFHKPARKPIGLILTLVISNLVLIAIVCFSGGLVWASTKVTAWTTEYYAKERRKLIQAQTEQAIALEQLNVQVSNLVGLQSSPPEDVLFLARKISIVLGSANGQQRQFIENALPHAIRIQVQYGIPASVVIAQGAYESSWGTSDLATKAHNYFGIKAFNWKGPFVTMPTRDRGVLNNANFRAYPDRSAGFQGYADFLRESPRYQSAFNTKSGIEFLKKILAAGYCPDASYAAHVNSIMKDYNLIELDNLLKQGANAPYQMAITKKGSSDANIEKEITTN